MRSIVVLSSSRKFRLGFEGDREGSFLDWVVYRWILVLECEDGF